MIITDRIAIQCPKCGNDDMIDRVLPCCAYEHCADHLAVVVVPDNDDAPSPIGTRGGHVSISLACGCGHHFKLVIANHKGMEFIGIA